MARGQPPPQSRVEVVLSYPEAEGAEAPGDPINKEEFETARMILAALLAGAGLEPSDVDIDNLVDISLRAAKSLHGEFARRQLVTRGT